MPKRQGAFLTDLARRVNGGPAGGGGGTTAHLHDDRYALTEHLHDDRYSLIGHDHDGAYAAIAHAPTHQHAGSDEIAQTTAAANAIPKAEFDGKLNNAWLRTGSGGGLDADTVDGVQAVVLLLADGSRALTADWDIGDGRAILAGLIKARDVNGLRLEDDGGNLGVVITDGGKVGIGGAPVTHKFEIIAGDLALENNRAFRIKDLGGVARGMLFMNDSDLCALGPQGGSVVRTQIHVGSTLSAIAITRDHQVGIGNDVTAPGAQLHIDQDDTVAAIPVLLLDQADLSEEFIEFTATVGEGNPIEAVGAKTLTATHFLRVHLTGVGDRYIPVGTIA